MISKWTVVGMIIGVGIIAIGVFSFVSDVGLQVVPVSDTLGPGEFTSYQVTSDRGGTQKMGITGDSFELVLKSPAGGLDITDSFEGEAYQEWSHAQDGVTYINVRNTGPSDVVVDATFEITTDPILFTYHIIVITSGVVIIGFSTAFTLRRPRGF